MTPAQQMRLTGLRANLRHRGRQMITDTDETVTALVDDGQPLPDPTNELKQSGVVFAFVVVEQGKLKSPREVGWFRETAVGGRNYKVMAFNESAADGVTWKFECEAQRKNVPTDEEDPEEE